LWWGHQIPAFHCADCGEITVTREDAAKACAKCGGSKLTQDPDVLDTWFSSQLWPFATLGWPNKTPELARYYPAADMETGYDIIFFWVARMIMMGLHFMGDVPFKRVLLHGMVVDETGDKMSKVKGNTLDPLDLIHGASFEAVVQKALPEAPVAEALTKFKKSYPSAAGLGKGFAAYGADALRMTLCSYSPQAKRIALSPARVDGYRKFCNKIYNATRFALTYIKDEKPSGKPPESPKLLINRWLLSRLSAAVTGSTAGIDEYRLDDGSKALYVFFWDELCNWFVEMTKPIFTDGSAEAQTETRATLAHCLEVVLRALHPYMPFITEELWQLVPKPAGHAKSVALASYPTLAEGRPDAEAEREMGWLMAAISGARTVRSEHGIKFSNRVPLELRSAEAAVRQVLLDNSRMIQFLASTDGPPTIAEPSATRPRGSTLNVAGDVEVLVTLKGHIDPAKESERIDREVKRVSKDIDVMEKRLANQNFVANAPADVLSEARALLDSLKQQKARLEEGRELVKELSE
jgi:valyl-tRNA synthetase